MVRMRIVRFCESDRHASRPPDLDPALPLDPPRLAVQCRQFVCHRTQHDLRGRPFGASPGGVRTGPGPAAPP
ncbi:hypothetical protein TR51_05360 [Kitasatospora griseola]|uniref:Uncharacterized protein n=1 Tax=Kitasatospora griseola TaxID=2064 RepID=A0A0D0PWQ0_KITGR|nr:hypothetical protein TR51_05360 [Kitasatospora griseola]